MNREFSLEEFIPLVEEMRGIQKDYFRVRTSYTLKKAKEKEKEIDAYIEAWKRKDEPKQASMF